METGCSTSPKYEAKWAEGMAHAWFCGSHWPAWKAERDKTDDIDFMRELTDGHASDKWGDAPGKSMEKTAAKHTGEYQGKPASPDSVKKVVEYGGLTIKIDRPKGFVMRGTNSQGKPWERTYKYDYGFIPKTEGGDGDGVDVFIGPLPDDQEAYWARKLNDDGTFDEYKVFLGFGSRQAAEAAFKEHIPAKFLAGVYTMKINLMKAMLGISPAEKLAMYLAFSDELRAIQ